jgi:hypothetical protein
MAHTVALIYYAMRAFSKDSKPVFIKLHPDISKNQVISRLGRLSSLAHFTEESLDALKDRFDMVIHTGTTAAMECMSMGKRVYKLKVELLDVDPLDGLTPQNEIDESTVLDTYEYRFYPDKSDILYEDLQKNAWLDLYNREN